MGERVYVQVLTLRCWERVCVQVLTLRCWERVHVQVLTLRCWERVYVQVLTLRCWERVRVQVLTLRCWERVCSSTPCQGVSALRWEIRTNLLLVLVSAKNNFQSPSKWDRLVGSDLDGMEVHAATQSITIFCLRSRQPDC